VLGTSEDIVVFFLVEDSELRKLSHLKKAQRIILLRPMERHLFGRFTLNDNRSLMKGRPK
jgi:hypothetical protein